MRGGKVYTIAAIFAPRVLYGLAQKPTSALCMAEGDHALQHTLNCGMNCTVSLFPMFQVRCAIRGSWLKL